jgi:hypothetical protein
VFIVRIIIPRISIKNCTCEQGLFVLASKLLLNQNKKIDEKEQSLTNNLFILWGHAVAQLVEALRYKPERSIPDGVTGIFQ